MAKKDGGPAIPVSGSSARFPGVTLRDYFAAVAMQGLIASNDDEAGDRLTEIPNYAYGIADAMLAEREKD